MVLVQTYFFRYHVPMGIMDLFSKRQKTLRGEVSDVYVYDTFPNSLRVQIVHIFGDALGNNISPSSMELYDDINKNLAKEYGLFTLGKYNESSNEAIFNFILKEKNYEKVIDIIEYILKVIDFGIREDVSYITRNKVKINADEAIEEMNGRFKENGVGYSYQSGQIIRMDSEFLHTETIKPVLNLLRNPIYSGANQEFLSAFEHYRHKRQKEALVEALKAFESVMKSICTKRKWTFSPNEPAKKLLEVIFTNKLVPDFMQSHFGSLRSMLETGVPTVRNRLGGHGQGEQIVPVSDYFVEFAINSTASAILLLVNAEKEF
jgi:AbiJ N-terminal domain 4